MTKLETLEGCKLGANYARPNIHRKIPNVLSKTQLLKIFSYIERCYFFDLAGLFPAEIFWLDVDYPTSTAIDVEVVVGVDTVEVVVVAPAKAHRPDFHFIRSLAAFF